MKCLHPQYAHHGGEALTGANDNRGAKGLAALFHKAFASRRGTTSLPTVARPPGKPEEQAKKEADESAESAAADSRAAPRTSTGDIQQPRSGAYRYRPWRLCNISAITLGMFLTIEYASYAPYEHMEAQGGRQGRWRPPGADEAVNFHMLQINLQNYLWTQSEVPFRSLRCRKVCHD